MANQVSSKFPGLLDEFMIPEKKEVTAPPKEIADKNTGDKQAEKTKPTPSQTTEKKERASDTTSSPSEHTEKKKAIGRPKKKETRKQHTVTLMENDYQRAMRYAEDRDISFAKLVEKALNEYLNAHA